MLDIIIVDDELDALEALEWKLNHYIKDVNITLCQNPFDAIDKINTQKPDIVFLDIQMPLMDGFEILEKIEYKKFHLIINTAHDEFALKAIKFSAIDYLLKPVDKDELFAAIEKVKSIKKDRLLENRINSLINSVNNGIDKVNISADGKVYLFDHDEVIMLKSDKSYTTLFLANESKIVVTKTLKEVEKKFQHPHFFRVHNSYVINLNHIKEYLKGFGGELIMSNGMTAAISRTKKSELLKLLDLN